MQGEHLFDRKSWQGIQKIWRSWIIRHGRIHEGRGKPAFDGQIFLWSATTKLINKKIYTKKKGIKNKQLN